MYGWGWYGVRGLQVVPYMNGTPVYIDGMMSHLYFETKRLGRIEQTFCGDHFNLDKFVAYFESLKTMQVLCTIGEKLKPVGYSWVASPKGVDGARSASPGFCFFDDAVHVARDLARLAVAYALEDLRIDTLLGVQTVDNLAARNFSRRLGFTECAIVPDYHSIDGELVAARVMILRKADFWPNFLSWKEERDAVSSVSIEAEAVR